MYFEIMFIFLTIYVLIRMAVALTRCVGSQRFNEKKKNVKTMQYKMFLIMLNIEYKYISIIDFIETIHYA